MSWDYKPITIKERLGRLESQLDELISLQEGTRNQAKENSNSRSTDYKDTIIKKCDCVNLTPGTCNLVNDHLSCLLSKPATAPLSDISKFLQRINLNISKGTQAITKIVGLTTQNKNDDENNSKLYHENCLKKNNVHFNDNKISFTIPSNEDNLFKEIREEKEKRQKAENQVKSLREEIKISRAQLQQNSDSILMLNSELKQTLGKLEETKIQLHKLYQDQQASESLWHFRYQALSKELENEQMQRTEAERNAQALRDKLTNEFDCTEKNIKIQSTINWLRIQNQHLTCLIEKLQTDIERMKCEILNKNQTLEDNSKKMRQLINVCEKLRDHLIVMKEKAAYAEERLRNNLIHYEKLTNTLLKEQEKIEELNRIQIRGRKEQEKLLLNVRSANASSEALQARLDEKLEIVRQQKDLIDRQCEKLKSKEDQIKLAYENIKLRSEREIELKNKIKSLNSELNDNMVNNDLNEIKLDLEKQREKVLIQEKIVESHLQTTIKLKSVLSEKENDIHQLKIDISEKDKKITIEQNTNYHLLSKIKSLQCCKQELKQKIKDLEDELEAQESTEQAKRLDLIEKQIMEKQKQLEEQNSLIKKEKDTILETLRCTTQELESTIAELKEQLTAQEQNVKILSSQLSDKDRHLKDAFEKISVLSHELEEVTERARKIENSYQEKLKSACVVWKNTMQMLQS